MVEVALCHLAREVEEGPAACLPGEVAVVGALHALLVVAEGAVDLLHQEVVGVVAGPWIQGVGAVEVAHEVCHLEVGVVAMEVPLLQVVGEVVEAALHPGAEVGEGAQLVGLCPQEVAAVVLVGMGLELQPLREAAEEVEVVAQVLM